MLIPARTRWLMLAAVGALTVVACGGDDKDTANTSAPDGTDAATPVADTADTTDAAPDTTAPDTTTPGSAIVQDGNTYTIDWSALAGPAFFAPPSAGSSDPFFHIHSDGATDGFFFSLELYTTGYGPLWTGQLGTFPIGCAADSTGICAHFDPDGPGPTGDLGADFGATGSITINQLDASGYSIDVGQITFSNGSVIEPFTLAG